MNAQLEAPAAEYEGGAQAVHEPAPAFAYVPATHSAQAIAPAGEAVPAGQIPHTVLLPTTAHPTPALVSGMAAESKVIAQERKEEEGKRRYLSRGSSRCRRKHPWSDIPD